MIIMMMNSDNNKSGDARFLIETYGFLTVVFLFFIINNNAFDDVGTINY